MIIPAGVIGIGDEAFEWCDSLTNISVTAGNPYCISVGGVLYNKAETALIQFPAGLAVGVYTIPMTVKSIGAGAFGDSDLTSVMIPNSVTNIGKGAFNDCWMLPSLIIPTNIMTINDEVFEWCSSLTNVTIGSGVTKYWQQRIQLLLQPGGHNDSGSCQKHWCYGICQLRFYQCSHSQQCNQHR